MEQGKDQVLALAISLMILPIPFVCFRLWARRLKRASYGADDALTLFALALNTGSCVSMIIGAMAGNFGQHEVFGRQGMPLTTPRHIVSFKVQYALQILSYLGDGITKLAVLLLYRRIFASRKFRWLNTVWICIIAAWAFSYLLATITQCSPPSILWNHTELQFTPACGKVIDLYLSGAITDLLTDIFILVLPIPMVFSLHMPLRRRFGVICVFLLGAFVVATGATRIWTFYTVGAQARESLDYSFVNAKTYYWTTAETSVGIVCCCLPTLPPLVDKNISGSLANIIHTHVPGLSYRSRQPGSHNHQQLFQKLDDSSFSAPSRSGSDGRKHEHVVNSQRVPTPRTHDGIGLHDLRANGSVQDDTPIISRDTMAK